MSIQPSQPSNLNSIQALYDAAIKHQETRGNHVWESVDNDALQREIAQGAHYSLWQHDKLCAVFGICYTDPIIWGEMEQGDALYLHRIAIHPNYMGQGLFRQIMEWASTHATQHERSRLRMDTRAVNTKIVSYYETRGFHVIGKRLTPAHPSLPKQNHNLEVTLLEKPIDPSLPI